LLEARKSAFRRERISDAEVVTFARLLLSEYRRSGSITKALSRARRARRLPPLAAHLVRKLEIAQTSENLNANRAGPLMKELLLIAAYGMETGSNVEEALDVFVTRASREIELGNKLKVRMGGAQALTRLGMGVFFPLFSGITSIILQSSASLSGSAPPSQLGLAALSCSYVLVILYISTAFAHPENAAPRNIISILPYFASALCILVLVPGVLTHVL
jgi:hypothetical protein